MEEVAIRRCRRRWGTSQGWPWHSQSLGHWEPGMSMLWDSALVDASGSSRGSRSNLPSTKPHRQCRISPSAGKLSSHLGNPFWSNEGPSLDVCQPSPRKPLYQLDLRRQRYYLLLILQSVSRSDLCDSHAVAVVVRAFLTRLSGRVNGRCKTPQLAGSQAATATSNCRS